MASVDTTNNPNDPNNPNAPKGSQAPQGQTNQPTTTGGAGAVTATGAGNVTGQVVGTANPSQPFQNIASYLSANEPQSQQLAGQVASTVSQPIAKAGNDITTAANTFTGQVGAGYTPANNDLITAVSSNPAYVVGENPDNVNNFLAQLHNTYTGPTDFTQSPGYGNLESEIANAQGQAQATQTPQGIQTLLNSVEGPTTAGINRLDSLLLTNNPANIQTVKDAGTGAAALPGTLTNTAAAQNAAATAGANTASTTSAAAAKALQDAFNSEQTNLSGQQNTIQGIVDEYNKSIGVINPVTQNIASDIQNYLAANPNLKLSNATDVLAPLENLQNLAMPSESSYASPFDYQTISALAKLGIDPSMLSGLPINSSTADQAQTFQIPAALQNAVGQAPGVESALNSELTGLGDQITAAYKPYQDLTDSEMRRADVVNQVSDIQNQLPQLKQAYDNAAAIAANPQKGSNPTQLQADAAAAQKAYQDAQAKLNSLETSPDYHVGNYWDQIAQMSQGLQWLSPASTGYNDLISAINSELGKLGSVGVPTLNYSPTSLTDPVTGAPIGKIGKDAGNAAALGIGVGAPAAAGAGLLSGTIPTTAAQLASMAPGTVAGEVPAAGLSAAQMAGPAALAAYGTSNIVQNSAAHPIESGLSTLANMGISLATLSLPPQIFNSIGKNLKNVINSIGDFFGGLF